MTDAQNIVMLLIFVIALIYMFVYPWFVTRNPHKPAETMSQVLKELADELGIPCIDLPLPKMKPEEMVGIPVVDEEVEILAHSIKNPWSNYFVRTLEKIHDKIAELPLQEVNAHYSQGQQLWGFEGVFEGHVFEIRVVVNEQE